MFKVKNLKDLLEVINRDRCAICGDLANGSKFLNIPYPDEDDQSQNEVFFFCSPEHEDATKKLLERWNK